MRFRPDSNVMVCGTENGYVVVLRLTAGAVAVEQGLTRCIHRGSVEGLAVDREGLIVTVASDCTIVLQNVVHCLDPKHIRSLTHSLL